MTNVSNILKSGPQELQLRRKNISNSERLVLKDLKNARNTFKGCQTWFTVCLVSFTLSAVGYTLEIDNKVIKACLFLGVAAFMLVIYKTVSAAKEIFKAAPAIKKSFKAKKLH